jgi:uncharacterized membrane protein YdjX (TVP38/TMEM64 family)
MYLFQSFVDWIREDPYEAIIGIVFMYICVGVFMLPISQFHILIGFTYAQVFKSSWIGWQLAAPVAMLGSLAGASAAFFMSRYVLRDFVKEKIAEN